MKISKKILSLLLVLILCFTTVAISSLTSGSADEATCAFMFRTKDYRPNHVNNKPEFLDCTNDGIMTMESTKIQKQYQMMFEITGSNKENLATAIQEACDYYNGALYLNVSVNKATNKYGSACSPEIMVNIIGGKTNSYGVLEPDQSKIIATTGQNRQPSERSMTYMLDVSQYMDTEYNDEAKFVFVQVQCYDWGCGSNSEDGGTIPNVTFYPLYVDVGEEITQPPVATEAPDPNRKTFLNFSPGARNDYQNGPQSVHYSADGAVWVSGGATKPENYGYARFTQNLNLVEQMQVSYGTKDCYEDAKNALNIVNSEGGTGKLKFRITLEKCIDAYGNPAIAEISLQVVTQIGNGTEAPKGVQVQSWQYPGTTRTYFLDVSGIGHISQIKEIVIRAQNYWYYDKNDPNRQLFDYDAQIRAEGGEPDENVAMAQGLIKCRIKPTLVVSPITALMDNTKEYNNTPRNLVLDDYNANGGKVPDVITLVDPNADDVPDPTTNPNGGSSVSTTTKPGEPTTALVAPATPKVNSVKLVAKRSAKITWTYSDKATHYEIYRATGSNKEANFKLIQTVSKQYLSTVDATLKNGKKYFYKVKAKNVSNTDAKYSGFSNVKSVKVINYAARPKIKLTAGKKSLSVKLTKKVTNATSYQVQYSTSSKFKKPVKSTTLKTKKTIKKLTKGKTYYVRVRARVKINGKYQYSKWSYKAKVKVK